MYDSVRSPSVKSEPHQIPNDVYRRHVLRARGRGNHFNFCRDYTRLMTLEEAVFLQDILNRASSKKAKVRGDWFLCTVRYLERSLCCWDRHTQTDLFFSLRQRGYVKVEMRGMPRRRWVYIDIEKLETDLDAALLLPMPKPSPKRIQPDHRKRAGNQSTPIPVDCKTQSPPNGGHCPTPNGGRNKGQGEEPTVVGSSPVLDKGKNTHTRGGVSGAVAPSPLPREGEVKTRLSSAVQPVERNGHHPVTHEKKTTPPELPKKAKPAVRPLSGAVAPDPGKDAAVRLYDALAKKRKITPNTKQALWPAVLRKFRDGMDPARFDSVLEWYCGNVGGRYVPEAYCARTFCLKFLSIESAMKRSAGEEEDDAPTIIQLDEEGQWVLGHVEASGTWPNGSRRLLPSLVGQSLEAYRDYWDRLIELGKSYGVSPGGMSDEEPEGFAAFLKRVMDGSYQPADFVIEWFRGTDDYARGRGVKPFSVRSKRFRGFGRDLSEGWDASGASWDRLMEELGYDA